MKLDNTDVKILDILQNNGRITNAELAKRIKISPPPTAERVKKLENAGVINRYAAIVDPEKVGIESFVFVEVTLNRHVKDSINKFIRTVKKIDEILECYHVTGEGDFLLKVATCNIKGYENLVINKLTGLPNILHLKTSVVLSTIKNETALKIKGETK
ncbi:MAG: Lrp/AsnC family transcriptional regulator [Chlorobi bacterium]|nr:Lrp/AsnC family transcriptional regulator [Chlorobiota bacterium]